MKRFIIKTTLVFLLFVLLFTTVNLVICKNRYKVIPFINSVSFDSKIYELKQRHFETIDNIAVGSSMTLNNLNTKACLKYFGNESFYNVSSWGQGINCDYEMIQILVERYSPKRIIMITDAGDFHEDELDYKESIKVYLNSDIFDLPFMMFFKINTKYYDSDEDYRSCRKATKCYTNLNYDECGGAELNVYGEDIWPSRWNKTSSFVFDRENDSYEALIGICEYLKEKKVDFLLINTPARRHFCCNNMNEINKHVSICDSIVSSYGFFYSNEIDFEVFDDSMFSDYAHLNAKGSRLLTETFLQRYFSNE